jgi:hypothetical protein
MAITWLTVMRCIPISESENVKEKVCFTTNKMFLFLPEMLNRFLSLQNKQKKPKNQTTSMLSRERSKRLFKMNFSVVQFGFNSLYFYRTNMQMLFELEY